MSLSLNNDGRPVCLIEDGKQAGRMIFLSDDSKGFSRIKDNGRFVQLPNTKTRDICFISGAAGSGKSYYAAKYIETFSWVFPNGAIYVFSKIKNDPTFSNIAKMPNVTFVSQVADSDKFIYQRL